MNQHTHDSFQDEFSNYRPKPNGEADPAGEAGWFLQRERERRRIDLRNVATAIRVHPVHLDAIERGDLTRMPHRSDAIGMVGAYAEYLGFDPQPMMMHYAQLLPKHSVSAATKTKRPRPLGSARIIDFPLAKRLKSLTDGAGGVVASVFAAIVLFGGASYALLPDAQPSKTGEIVAVQEGQETPAKSEVETTVEVTETPLAEEPSEQVADIDPADDPIGALLSKQADDAADSLSGLDKLIANNGEIIDTINTATTKAVERVDSEVARDDKGRIFGIDNKDARLVLRATAPVWVRVEDGKGKSVLTETLMAGDSFRVPNQDGLVVIARDGGLLRYEIDGKAVGSLGKPGEILVNRSLEVNALLNQGS